MGIGPGGYEDLTIRAAKVLDDAEVIVGYGVYVGLVRGYFPDRKFITTPMTQEEKRCRLAFEEAEKGTRTALICGGDAGVYGLAGLAREVGVGYPEVTVETVPGVTAATAGAARLGAPLIHDFAVVSLSDRLTPWEVTGRRLAAAAAADYVLVLYNPASRSRPDTLAKACDVIRRWRSPETVCGLAENISREGEETRLCSLSELPDLPADMFTTVFVGNSHTKILNGKMVTPRGYTCE